MLQQNKRPKEEAAESTDAFKDHPAQRVIGTLPTPTARQGFIAANPWDGLARRKNHLNIRIIQLGFF